jgi:predicted nucleic acid-binding protein
MAEYLLADTSVVSRLTKGSPDCSAYEGMIGERRLAVSFQTEAELLGWKAGEARRQRLNDLLAAMLRLPHSEATTLWYSRVVQRRAELQRSRGSGANAQDADAWIISSALEHNLAMLSHDQEQVHLGRAMGLKVLTNLPGLREANPKL